MAQEKKNKLSHKDKCKVILNKVHSRGIIFQLLSYDAYNEHYNIDYNDISANDFVDYISYNPEQLIGRMHFNCDVIAIKCYGPAPFKWLDLSFAVEDRMHGCFFYVFQDNPATFEELEKALKEVNSSHYKVIRNPHIYFNLYLMPKIHEPKGRKYTSATLPILSKFQLDEIIRKIRTFETFKEYHFQINTGEHYRISTSMILNVLSSPILSVNERKVLESVLRTITNSTFVLDTSQTDKEFRIPLKAFCKGLKLSRSKETIADLITSAFEHYQYIGWIDTFEITDDMLIFTASGLAGELSRQNIQRQYGFYNNIPGNKRASVIASWLDYLYIITSFTRENKTLKTALDTLLDRLYLMPLLEKHRIKDIAEWLNILKDIGIKYGLIVDDNKTFDNVTVHTLLKDRKLLHQYINLMEVKRNGNA